MKKLWAINTERNPRYHLVNVLVLSSLLYHPTRALSPLLCPEADPSGPHQHHRGSFVLWSLHLLSQREALVAEHRVGGARGQGISCPLPPDFYTPFLRGDTSILILLFIISSFRPACLATERIPVPLAVLFVPLTLLLPL